MKIINNLLEGVKYITSPNAGKGINSRKYCVIHYTASLSADSAIGWMTNKESKVSAHLHIDRKGAVVQLVTFDKVAWHAGKSFWKGIEGLNSHSIGIELSATATSGFTTEQIKTLIEVGKSLNDTYKGIEYVGHEDIAPGRKTDPGKLFPWKEFREGMKGECTSLSKITTADLNLRRSAKTGDVISVLPKGTSVTIIDSDSEWSQVKSGLLIGFVSNKYLV